jgi:hypothetical protein
LITVVGHGIWVFLAAILRVVTGAHREVRPVRAEYETKRTCPECGSPIPQFLSRCEACRLSLGGNSTTNVRDLKTTLRQLGSLRDQGLLDQHICDAAVGSIQAHLDALIPKRKVEATEPLLEVLPVVAPEPVAPEPVAEAVPLRLQVEKVLEVYKDVRAVAAQKKDQVVDWYQRVVAREVEEEPSALPVVVEPVAQAIEAPPAPVRRRRSLAEVLGAFMQESNIVWGELVAGLVMVGSSVALVISLWKTLEESVPYFPFMIFTAITVAIFGAGLYSLSHWKLESTSRGLLVIATLLVPLNFLVMAGLLVQRGETGGGFNSYRLASEAAALAAFAYLLGKAGHVLVAEARWLLALAVLGISASALASPRLLEEGRIDLWRSLAAGLLPTVCFVAGSAGLLYRQQRPIERSAATRMLLFLGLVTFPLLLSLGFLVFWSQETGLEVREAFQRMALLLAAAGVPILAIGLAVQRTGNPEPDRSLAMLRAAGTVVTLCGMTVMLAAVPLAWPDTWTTLLVCVLNFVVLTVVAIRLNLPVAHLAALPCMVIAYLTAYHQFIGLADGALDAQEALLMLTSKLTGAALVPLVLALALTAELLVRTSYRVHGIYYAFAGSLLALASLLLVNLHGLGDPGRAAFVTGIYAVSGLAANLRWQRREVDFLALALAPLATIWGLEWQWPTFFPIWGPVLASESLVLGAVAVFAAGRLITPSAWKQTALCVGIAALGMTIFSARTPPAVLTDASLVILAFAGILLARAYQRATFSWVASTLLLAGMVHCSIWTVERAPLSNATSVAVLVHASLMLAVGLLLRMTTNKDGLRDRLYGRPLPWMALVSSCLAPVCWYFEIRYQFELLAKLTAWLALLWLVIAVLTERAILCWAFQAALSGSVLFAATAWLRLQPWVQQLPIDLLDPRSLQVYGIGLAGLGLFWLAGRALFEKHERAQKLLQPAYPAFDWMALSVVVLGQFLLAAFAVAFGIFGDVIPAASAFALPGGCVATFGPTAWLLVGVLAANLVPALRSQEQRAALYGLILLASTAPLLWAGGFGNLWQERLALNWGLSVVFLTVSVLSWLRAQLSIVGAKLGLGQELENTAARTARWLLMALTIPPIVFLTLYSLGGPSANLSFEFSFFAALSPAAGVVTPLVLICVGLVGHGIRECRAGYVFGAGLVSNLAVVTWYLISSGTANRLGVVETVHLLQLFATASAGWSLLVLASRPWIAAWREGDHRPAARALFSLQLLQPIVANAVVLSIGTGLLTVQFPAVPSWSAEVGTPLGRSAFLLMLAAILWRAWEQRRVTLAVCYGLIPIALVGLAACTTLRWQPAWAYRTLLLGWAIWLPVCVAVAWLIDRRRSESTIWKSLFAPAVVALWARLLGSAVVGLAIQAALLHHDHLWAAAALFLVGTAGACLAVWRSRESWAFIAGLVVNLAASFVVWHYRLETPFQAWWLQLAQANIVAAALVALLWLGARKLVYEDRPNVGAAPLLATQIALAFAANTLLLIGPCARLVMQPWQTLPAEFTGIGSLLGWAALGLTVSAAFWFAGTETRGQRGHVLMSAGLLTSILLAVTQANRSPDHTWLAYHLLMAGWTVLGLALVVAEPLTRWRASGADDFSPFPKLLSVLNFDVQHFRSWLFVLGSMVLVLALRAAAIDPQRPYWSSGATLAVAAMVGATAIRSRSQVLIYVSGLLLPLACLLAWISWYPLDVTTPRPAIAYSLGYTLLLGLALSSLVWSLIEFVLRSGTPAVTCRGQVPAFVHLAVWLAQLLGGTLLVGSFPGDLMYTSLPVSWVLPASALATLALAFLVLLWDAESPTPIAGLYGAGVLALGLALQAQALPASQFWSMATLAMSSFLLFAGILSSLLPRMHEFWRALRLPAQAAWPQSWFLVSQTTFAIVLIGLSLWLTLTFSEIGDRMIGPAAVALLTLTAVLFATDGSEFWAARFRSISLTLAVLAVAELGWAALDPGSPAIALHRHVYLVLALAAMTPIEGILLPRLLKRMGAWADSARRSGPVLLAITTIVLVGLLGHEGVHFDKVSKHTPLFLWETVGVAIALLSLIASAICFAVAPATDPYGLSERRRPVYVYTAELFLLFLFIHIRLNVPELFGGVLTKFWPLVVMAIAFVGIGLSEYFKRSKLRILAVPLERTGVFMPLLPLLAFWARPPQGLHDSLVDTFPGLHPALDPLMKLEPNFGRYAILWFTAGLLYSWLASIKKSFRFALVAALAANFGLWALFFNADLTFFSHPQLWMIPLALIVLVSEHIHRQELGPKKSNALRYLGLIMIYVSSTADMFLAWGENSYLPLILAGLSVLGVLAGIMLRVTAFLYLGTSFLFVVVFSMIWHAAVDGHQMWLWWASGIALGAVIFALFAVFEKRREDVLRLIEDIKSWE